MQSPITAARPWPTCSGPVGIGRHVLHARAVAAAAVVAAVGGALLQHLADLAAPGGLVDVEVDEAGTGDLDLGEVGVGRQRVDQRLRDRARVRLRRLGQQHGRVGRKIALRQRLGTLDHELGRGKVGRHGTGGAEGVDGLRHQGAESGFHGDLRGAAGPGIVREGAVRPPTLTPSRARPATPAHRRRRRGGRAGARRPGRVLPSGAR